MSIIEKQFAMTFSSNPLTGSYNISDGGSRFSIQLSNPITIPRSYAASVEVVSAFVWNSSPNISAARGNNKFRITTTVPPAVGTATINVTIPDGLYGLGDLASVIQRAYTNLGYPTNLLQWSASEATQKVIITFPHGLTQIDFTIADSVRLILGFNSGIVPPAPAGIGESIVADNIATFNQVTSYRIRGDLTSLGIPVGNINNGTICVVPINVKPGSQIVYLPTNPPRVDVSSIKDSPKNILSFQLTDQNGGVVSSGGEYWEFTCVFRYLTLQELTR